MQNCFLPGFQPVLSHKVIPTLIQDFAFAFVKLYKVSINPFIQDAEVLLNSSPALQCNSCALQFAITHKLAVSAVHSIIQVFIKGVKQY